MSLVLLAAASCTAAPSKQPDVPSVPVAPATASTSAAPPPSPEPDTLNWAIEQYPELADFDPVGPVPALLAWAEPDRPLRVFVTHAGRGVTCAPAQLTLADGELVGTLTLGPLGTIGLSLSGSFVASGSCSKSPTDGGSCYGDVWQTFTLGSVRDGVARFDGTAFGLSIDECGTWKRIRQPCTDGSTRECEECSPGLVLLPRHRGVHRLPARVRVSHAVDCASACPPKQVATPAQLDVAQRVNRLIVGKTFWQKAKGHVATPPRNAPVVYKSETHCREASR